MGIFDQQRWSIDIVYVYNAKYYSILQNSNKKSPFLSLIEHTFWHVIAVLNVLDTEKKRLNRNKNCINGKTVLWLCSKHKCHKNSYISTATWEQRNLNCVSYATSLAYSVLKINKLFYLKLKVVKPHFFRYK